MKHLLLASTLLAPIAAHAQPAGCSAGFGILDGVIYGIDNKPFLPHGVNVLYGGQPSAAEILSRFPGTNFVRLATYHYEQDAAFVAYVADLTSHGMVVLIEDHSNGVNNAGGGQGAIFSGSALSTELAWDAAMGRTFLNNPLVWHASNNEPSMNVVANNGVYDGGALSRWQLAEYQAFRGTGNNAPFFFELNVFNGGQTGAAIGYDPAVYAQTDNSGWDRHVYAGQASGAQVASDLATSVSQAKQIKSAGGQTMAVGVFEMGDSMMGMSQDPAWRETLSTVFNSGFGWAAWGWGVGPGDNLIGGGAYEQTVAAEIAASSSGPVRLPTNCTPAAASTQPTTSAVVVAQTQAQTGQSDRPATEQTQQPAADPPPDPLRLQLQDMQQQAAVAEANIQAKNPSTVGSDALAAALAAGAGRIAHGQ